MARPKQKRRPSSAPAQTGTVPIGVWALIVGSLILIIVAVIVGSQSANTAEPQQGAAGSEEQQSSADDVTFDVERRIDGDVTAMGDVDAPVVMVEYSDYRCPFCAVVSRETLPQIIEEYIDTGLLRYEWRDYPIFGDESMGAAIAGRAAGAQGKFWEYNEAIYAAAPARAHIDLPRERLIEFAEEVGVPDIEKFIDDLDNPEFVDAVEADIQEAKTIGVSSTPIFIIGNTPVVGAQPYEAFAEAIESELAEAGAK